MRITRKIEIVLEGTKEEKQYGLNTIKYYYNIVPIMSNLAVTEIFLNDLMINKVAKTLEGYEERLKELDSKVLEAVKAIKVNNSAIRENKDNKKKLVQLEENKINLNKKYKADKNKKNKYIGDRNKEARDIYQKGFGNTVMNSVYKKLRIEYPEAHSDLASIISNELKSYAKDMWKIKLGMERIKMFAKGMPIPTKSISLKFVEDDENIYINWIYGISFKIRFGADKNNNKEIVNRILSGTYKLKNSKIQYNPKRNKMFLLASLEIPQKKYSPIPGRIMGVDMGIKYPLYFSVLESHARGSLGYIESFFKVRTQMNSRNKRLKKDITYTVGRRGRKKKTQALKSFKNKERQWVRTYNHSISKKLIDIAIKNNVEIIALENLKKITFDKGSKILRYWSYYELQEFIEYKAQKYGIEIIKVDPAYTSQRCSECGHTEKGNRQTQGKFKCLSCGFEENADYNAARNIAKKVLKA